MKQNGIHIQDKGFDPNHINKLINGGHYEAAGKLLKKAEKKRSKDYNIIFLKGKLAAQTNKLDTAEAMFQLAITKTRSEENKGKAAYQLAKIHSFKNNHDRAKQVLERYKSNKWGDDKYTYAYLEAIKHTQDRNRLKSVLPTISGQLDKIRLLLLCSQSLLHTGQIQEAKRILHENLEACDDRVRACLMLITLHIDSGNFIEAIDLIESQPESIQNHEMIFREWVRLKHHIDPTEKWINKLQEYRSGKNLPYAEWTQAALEFEHGLFEAGSRHFEARYKADLPENRVKFIPGRKILEDGLRGDGQKTLVSAEQGVGDQIRFSRYFFGLKDSEKASFSVAVEERLAPLFQRSFPDIEFLETDNLDKTKLDALGIADEIIIGSVGLFPSHHNFPAKMKTPYLVPDPHLVNKLRAGHSKDKLTIGISWRSVRKNPKRYLWYPPLDEMAEMFEGLTNTELVCLQNNVLDDERSVFQQAGLDLNMTDIDCKDDIDGLAALCASVDVVVGVATATSELSASVGQKTFTLGNRDPERWYLSQIYMDAFYPDMHMFLSDTGTPWTDSLEAVRAELEKLAAEKSAKS